MRKDYVRPVNARRRDDMSCGATKGAAQQTTSTEFQAQLGSMERGHGARRPPYPNASSRYPNLFELIREARSKGIQGSMDRIAALLESILLISGGNSVGERCGLRRLGIGGLNFNHRGCGNRQETKSAPENLR